MKPFDIEKAREGHPVCFRNGKVPDDIHILADWLSCEYGNELVSTKLDSDIRSFYRNGRYFIDGEDSQWDLFLATEKREGWVAMDSNDQIVSFGIRSNEDEITQEFPEYRAVKITWEE